MAPLTPTLADAVRAASMKAFVLLDGTLLPIDRIAADRPFHSGKHKRQGLNVQVLTDPFGRLLWASPALPGAVHVVRAAREHGIIDALAQADVPCWADKGYRDTGGTVRIPYWGRWKTLSQGKRSVNRSHAKIRALSSKPSEPGDGPGRRQRCPCRTAASRTRRPTRATVHRRP